MLAARTSLRGDVKVVGYLASPGVSCASPSLRILNILLQSMTTHTVHALGARVVRGTVIVGDQQRCALLYCTVRAPAAVIAF